MQKTLKYGYKKDHLLGIRISQEAIDAIVNFADWKLSENSEYRGSIFAWETIKTLSDRDFYPANDRPTDEVLCELAELAKEMFEDDCDTVHILEPNNEKN